MAQDRLVEALELRGHFDKLSANGECSRSG